MTTTSNPTRQLAVAAAAGAVAGGLVVAVASLLDGAVGAGGATVGAAVTLVVFAFGAVSVAVASRVHPRGALAVALVTYLLQAVVLVAFFARLRGSGLLGETLSAGWLAVAVVAVTLAWTALQILAWQRGSGAVVGVPTGGER